jgi:hypothetical protein
VLSYNPATFDFASSSGQGLGRWVMRDFNWPLGEERV